MCELCILVPGVCRRTMVGRQHATRAAHRTVRVHGTNGAQFTRLITQKTQLRLLSFSLFKLKDVLSLRHRCQHQTYIDTGAFGTDLRVTASPDVHTLRRIGQRDPNATDTYSVLGFACWSSIGTVGGMLTKSRAVFMEVRTWLTACVR